VTSRRDFLRTAWATAVAAKLTELGWMATGDSGLLIPGKPGMIVRSERFLDLEMPPELLNSWITPVERFFVRNHMFEPTTVDARTLKLTIAGQVERPLELGLSDLNRYPKAGVINTLECAGNGRAFFQPHVPGVQWQKGAVGTARYTGIRLKDVLGKAGVKNTGKHVMFRGLDEVPGKVPPFIRSIPIEKAMHADTLLATEMNGRPLPKHHGFPTRVLVPGWIGAASCKWVTEIRVLEKPFEGNFMTPGYRMPNRLVKPGGAVDPKDTASITALNVKAVIKRPLDGATISGGVIAVSGAAWAGENQITKVEISINGGATWHEAKLGPEHVRYAWRLWSYTWRPKRGDHVVMARATDRSGRVQPAEAAWNPSGYLYNAIDQVKVHVV